MTDPIVQAITLPPTDTVEFFRAKGYMPAEYREHWDQTWQEEHARWFTVTKLFNNQLLEEVRRSLDTVLSKGGTFEQWKAVILPKLSARDKDGNLADGIDPRLLTSTARLRIVYDTNLRVSRAAGKWKRIQALKDRAPYLMYDAVNDGRTRPLHRVWGGLDTGRPTILPVDDPWWDTHFPPCGWGCRCNVIQLSDRDLRREGLKVTPRPPEPPARRYVRTNGDIESVPAGIDPGFAYNPGHAYLAALSPVPSGALLTPRIVQPDSPRPSMPTPTPMPASSILPANASQEDVVRAFMGVFDLPPDGQKIILDPTEEPIAIDRRMLVGVEGTLKVNKQGRAAFPVLAARALLEPDEIWQVWMEEDPAKAAKSGKAFLSRIRRRYVARFAVDGVDQTMVVMTDIGPKGWEGRTWFQERQDGYMDRTVRVGTLVWRRADKKEKGPAL